MAVTATRKVAASPAKDRPPIPQLMSRPPLRTVYSGVFEEKKNAHKEILQNYSERYILEEPPTERFYHYMGVPYHLWMPWTYYVLSIGRWKETGVHPSLMHILWLPEQLKTSNQPFFACSLPNLHGNGGGLPCFDQKKTVMGEEMEKLAGQYGSIFDWSCAFLYHQWWDGNANIDLFPIQNNFMATLLKRHGTPIEDGNYHALFGLWEEMDRGQVLDMPMTPTNISVNRLFPHLLKADAKIGLI